MVIKCSLVCVICKLSGWLVFPFLIMMGFFVFHFTPDSNWTLIRISENVLLLIETGNYKCTMCILWLQSIPASGQTLWCTLEKRGKAKKQGDVKIRLSFSSEKNPQVASQEHRHLLRLTLLHELENSKVCSLHIFPLFLEFSHLHEFLLHLRYPIVIKLCNGNRMCSL